MARAGKLTALEVGRKVKAAKPGYIGDGGGLYLQISKYGSASWCFRYRVGSKLREAGLGSLDTWSLAEARERAREFRQMRDKGLDPIEERRAKRQQQRLEAAKAVSFKDAAEQYISAHREGWRGGKSESQWRQSLTDHVFPLIGDLPVASIDVGLVLKVLEPLWKSKTETASRVRGRIERILDWAKTRSYREGENPARWKGHLEHQLPKPGKVKRIEHFAALPYDEIGALMADLRRQEGIAARALEFAILTAKRASEVTGARWSEINPAERIWIIPGERMKSGHEHRVRLSDAAMAIVDKMAKSREGEFVFPGGKTGKPLTSMAMLHVLRRIGRENLTVHGFRSTFSDWCAERTNFPAEVREMALAHAVGDKVEAAYRRGDLFQKRHALAEAWARFCAAPAAPGGKVVPINRAAVVAE